DHSPPPRRAVWGMMCAKPPLPLRRLCRLLPATQGDQRSGLQLLSPPFHFLRAYAPTPSVRSVDCLVGDSAISVAPIAPKTRAAISRSLRSFGRWIAIIAMTAA